MTIKILGSACPKCEKLKKNVETVVSDLNLKNVKIEKVEEIDEIISLGVMSTPALIIDDELKASGRIPEKEEIKKFLK
jgi:small redox-active disulfide protein 2